MTLRTASGTVVKLANIGTYTDVVTKPAVVVFLEDIYETYNQQGATQHEKNRRLAFYAGQEMPQAELEANWLTGTATSISPATGAAAGGTVCTITGTNLAGTTGITIGGNPGTAFSVLSDTQVKFTTPAHSAGAVSVTIADDAGDIVKAAFFTYV